MKRIVPLFLLNIISLPLVMRGAEGPGDPCPFQVKLGADTMICAGTFVVLNAEVPGATYFWSDWSTTPDIQVFFEGEYSVTVSKNGCEVSDTIYVGIKPSLYAEFSYAPHSDSTPATLAFSDLSSSCDGIVTDWIWDFGDGATSFQRNPVHSYTTPGDYDVILTVKDNFGSIYPTIKTVSVQTVTDTTSAQPEPEPDPEPEPQPEPEPEPAQEPEPEPEPQPQPEPEPPVVPSDTLSTNLCEGFASPVITQDDNMLKTGSAASYQWYREGVEIMGVDDKVIRVNQPGTYTVKVRNPQGCVAISEPYFFTPIIKNENSGELVVRCSPNPGNGIINITLSEVPAKPAKLTVYNFYGMTVYSTYVTDQVSTLTQKTLPKGIYTVEVLVNGKRKTTTAIVQ